MKLTNEDCKCKEDLTNWGKKAILNIDETIDVDGLSTYGLSEALLSAGASFIEVFTNAHKEAMLKKMDTRTLVLGYDNEPFITGTTEYHEPENENCAGNYSYEINIFANVKEEYKYVTVLEDIGCNETARNLLQAGFELLKYMTRDEVEDDITVLEIPGYFMLDIIYVEGYDEPNVFIIPDGAMKRLIKDDVSLEI